MTSIREGKYRLLLLAIILALAAQPLASGFLLGLILFDVLVSLAVVAVFLVVFERLQHRLAAVALAVPALVSNWAGYVTAGDAQLVALVIFHGCMCAFLAFAVAVILGGIFEQKLIEIDHVIGAFCGYLLAGVAWGNLYVVMELLVPGAFSVKQELAWQLAHPHTRRFLFNYFSYCTLTTVGYGDITPVNPACLALTWLEAVFGQFYVAVVVAQLVGLRLAQAITKAEQKSA